MKKLAIKGHTTRGKEVIELLEMMGGENINVTGGDTKGVYLISTEGTIETHYTYYKRPENYIVFTLEEFLEKYPFKVGDKVNSPCKGCVKTITSMKWDDYLNTVSYKLDNKIYTTIEQLKVVNELPYKETDDIKPSDSKCERTREDAIFDSIIWHLRNSVNNGKQNFSCGELEEYFREVVKKYNENKMKNIIAELFEHIKTTPKEELEREFNELKELSNVGPTVEEYMDFCNKVNKKFKYPKTYEECCEVLKEKAYTTGFEYKSNLIFNIQQLLICRNAYWKIVGEEMGLGKPWEPDLENEELYCIQNYNKQITISRTNTAFNKILIFPTEEMRDAFFENFKNLIKQCKELL